MEKKNYKKEVNPTYFTAKGTLYTLAGAKNCDAIEFSKLIDLSDLAKGFYENGNFMKGLPRDIFLKMVTGLECAVELRYNVVTKLLDNSKMRNFFDIACGYTPRALYCKKNNIDYLGVDVPIVIEEMNEKVGNLVNNGKHIPYISVDATNPNAVIKASENLKGEIFISCEGLILYFTIDELQEFIKGIKRVLAKHGGAWYTSDLGVDYKRVPLPFVNDKKIEEGIQKNVLSSKNTTDIKYFSNNFKTEEEKINFFENRGLKVEKIPIKDMGIIINQLENENDEVKENVKKLFDTFYCWKLTLKEEEKNNISNVILDNDVKILHNVENKTLKIKIVGRIDTISSPELLKTFDMEMQNSDINSIVIDADELEYISSAGIRVILKMFKAINEGHIEINGANQFVKNIFINEGFDEFVKIN